MKIKDKKTPTFQKDGKRRVKCPHCNKIVGAKSGYVLETRLGDKITRNCRCCHCKGIFILPPPKKGVKNDKGEVGIAWGANQSMWTADLTEDEIESTIKI